MRQSSLIMPKCLGFEVSWVWVLPTDISAIMKQNFVYRMLFRDIY